MLKKLMAGLVGVAMLLAPAAAQPPTLPPGPVPTAPMSPGVPESAGAAVPGLELPPDQTVPADEGFVTLQAKTKGEVNWLVLCVTGNVKVKYVTIPGSNSIIVSVPPVPGTIISVFAVGLVDGKMTPFVRSNIAVGGAPVPPGPVPPPNPNPNPNPPPPNPNPVPLKALHVTFVVDLNKTTPALAQILNNPTLRKGVTDRGNFFRLYDMNSPVIVQKKLDGVVQRAGGSAVLIIQREDGFVLYAKPVPATEAEILAEIAKVQGGN